MSARDHAAQMQWRSHYATGLEEIDAQHRELLSLFQRIRSDDRDYAR